MLSTVAGHARGSGVEWGFSRHLCRRTGRLFHFVPRAYTGVLAASGNGTKNCSDCLKWIVAPVRESIVIASAVTSGNCHIRPYWKPGVDVLGNVIELNGPGWLQRHRIGIGLALFLEGNASSIL